MTLTSNQLSMIHQQWYTYALQCVEAGIQYFQAKFGNDLEKPFIFKAARLFSSVRIHEMQPTASDLDQL